MFNLCPVQLFPREENAPIVCNCDPWLPLYSTKSPPSLLHVLELDVIILPPTLHPYCSSSNTNWCSFAYFVGMSSGKYIPLLHNFILYEYCQRVFFYKMVFLTATQRDWSRKWIRARILKKTSLARKEMSKLNISHSTFFHENLPVSHGTMMERGAERHCIEFWLSACQGLSTE